MNLWIRAFILGLEEDDFFSLLYPRLLVCLWVSDFDIFGEEDMPNSSYVQNLHFQTPHWGATWLGDNWNLKSPKDALSIAAAGQTPQCMHSSTLQEHGASKQSLGLAEGLHNPFWATAAVQSATSAGRSE